jgi:hypothetical protein
MKSRKTTFIIKKHSFDSGSVKDRGIGIIVRDSKRPTEASYALDGPAEVGRFLKSFADILQATR